jgi:hypothetical protein
VAQTYSLQSTVANVGQIAGTQTRKSKHVSQKSFDLFSQFTARQEPDRLSLRSISSCFPAEHAMTSFREKKAFNPTYRLHCIASLPMKIEEGEKHKEM